jgi:hypothetical protein
VCERFPARLRPARRISIVQQPRWRSQGCWAEESPNTPFAASLLADVRSRIDGGDAAGRSVRSELAGSYVSAVTQAAALRRDMIVEITVSTVAVLLFVWWFARSLMAAHLVFVPVVLAIGGRAGGGRLLRAADADRRQRRGHPDRAGHRFPRPLLLPYRRNASARPGGALHAAQVGMARPFVGIAATTLAAFSRSSSAGFRDPPVRLRPLGGASCSACSPRCLLFPDPADSVDRRIRPASERMPLGRAGRRRSCGPAGGRAWRGCWSSGRRLLGWVARHGACGWTSTSGARWRPAIRGAPRSNG